MATWLGCISACIASASCSEVAHDADVEVCSSARCAADEMSTAPVFRVGVRPVDSVGVAGFTAIESGGVAPVVIGGNGAWMVNLAVATSGFDCCVERVNLAAVLTSVDCGRELARLNLRRRPLAHGTEGLRYVVPLWLIVDDAGTWDGEEAVLTVSAEPYGGGTSLEQTLSVTLRRGDGPIPSLKLGTVDPGETHTNKFCSLPTYAELAPRSLGNGSTGLLLAARSAVLGADVAEVDIDATLTKWVKSNRRCPPPVKESCRMTSVELGRIEGRRHPLVRRGDGRAYALGIPLPLGSEAEWANEVGTLTLSLTPVGGGDTLTSSATFTILPAIR